MVSVTDNVVFGDSVPLDGLKVTPDIFVDADQLRSPCEPGARATMFTHV